MTHILFMNFYSTTIMEVADLSFRYPVNPMSLLLNGRTMINSCMEHCSTNSSLVKACQKDWLSERNWRHFANYYDGRFEDPLFIAHGFNQLQRVVCIRSSARITGKNAANLKSLGQLTNLEAFRQQLLWARDHPHQCQTLLHPINGGFNNSIQPI
jgi:hypothetical protein